MSLYQAKHKARGRYAVVNEQGQWLAGFLGSQQEALAKAKQLNHEAALVVQKTTNTTPADHRYLKRFMLTDAGWLLTGE